MYESEDVATKQVHIKQNCVRMRMCRATYEHKISIERHQKVSVCVCMRLTLPEDEWEGDL